MLDGSGCSHGKGRARKRDGSARGGLIKARRGAATAGLIMSLGLLAGCSSLNPVNWYRDLTGVSKDDPDAKAANTANLEAGSASPYPNLSSVPNTPTRGLTEAERDALADSLVADREHAKYAADQVQAADGTPVPADAAGAEAPPAVTASAAAPSSGDAAAPSAPAEATAPAPVEHKSHLAAGGALGGADTDAPPREADLKTPVARDVPPPDTPHDIPPAPAMAPTPTVAAQAAPLPTPQEPAAVPAAPDLSPPPVPAPAPGTPAAAATAPPAAAKRTKTAQVAEIAFAAGSNDIPASARDKLKDVPAVHKQYGGVVRVVGYAAAKKTGTDPAGQQLAAYQAALAHADAVKQALTDAGVPAADIVVEASPVQQADAVDRATVYVEY